MRVVLMGLAGLLLLGASAVSAGPLGLSSSDWDLRYKLVGSICRNASPGFDDFLGTLRASGFRNARDGGGAVYKNSEIRGSQMRSRGAPRCLLALTFAIPSAAKAKPRIAQQVSACLGAGAKRHPPKTETDGAEVKKLDLWTVNTGRKSVEITVTHFRTRGQPFAGVVIMSNRHCVRR